MGTLQQIYQKYLQPVRRFKTNSLIIVFSESLIVKLQQIVLYSKAPFKQKSRLIQAGPEKPGAVLSIPELRPHSAEVRVQRVLFGVPFIWKCAFFPCVFQIIKQITSTTASHATRFVKKYAFFTTQSWHTLADGKRK